MTRRKGLVLLGAVVAVGVVWGWLTWVWHLVAGEDPTEIGVGGWWDRRA